ncbi:hypothetical protein K3495_g3238 [Podosphaera aphanis]|nr:hypothetical protein K3495_g3238 [Podosphaera aphanis]
MTWLELATGPFQSFGVSEFVIRSEMKKRGYGRRVARGKPLSDRNKAIRKQWAEDHLHWTEEDWEKILWTDESWITDGWHTRTHITRKVGQDLDESCLVSQHRGKKGWMFWGCFAGSQKGPCIFWDKYWGKINAESYCDKIAPVIESMLSDRPWLSLMQDNAPPHAARLRIQLLNGRNIFPILWPSFSPDLNPIEAVWNSMKDFIQFKYPDLRDWKTRSLGQLRVIVEEAWDSVTTDDLAALVSSMPARCQAVLDANGGSTKY